MTDKNKTNNDLKSLIIHINDSVKGYEKAADCTRDDLPALATFFQDHARQRQVFVGKFESSPDHATDETTDRGSAEGSMHRALISVKDMFTSSKDADSVVEEAIRGEEKLNEYISDAFSDSEEFAPATLVLIDELRLNVEQSLSSLRAKLS